MKKKVVVIGSGFSGLTSAAYAAKAGHEVVLLEKNDTLGGRARMFHAEGFAFDMGPSWYWMPEVFEQFYQDFGYKASDFYTLVRLDPSYRVWWNSRESEYWDIPADMQALKDLFESHESGAAQKLGAFLNEAAFKYKEGIGRFVHLPGKSFLEYADKSVVKAAFRMQLFTSMAKHVRTYFKSPKLIELMEFPVLFLGATANDTPALYSLMNYADMQLGTWYPLGGMHEIVKAFAAIAQQKGVHIKTSSEVKGFDYQGHKIVGVKTALGTIPCDVVIATADYKHIDRTLLGAQRANYSESYWEKRKMAPSSLLYYLGVNKKIPNLKHHNLFFDANFQKHAHQIYKKPSWPSDPLFYVSVPSKTDDRVAPEGAENIFILIPTAPGLIEDKNIQQKYFELVMQRLEQAVGTDIRSHIVFRRDFAASDFIKDYHAHKGNAYGLANTLMQTGPLKPALRHKKIKNLIFAGQLTVPGPGVPPSIISGKLAAHEIEI